MGKPPLVVIEGRSPAALDQALAAAARCGWRVVHGWAGAGRGVVCAGVVDSPEGAQRAMLAVVAGAGVVVEATAERDVIDRLCDDLRRLGPVEHWVGGEFPPVLDDEERALLGELLAGASLGQAARRLNLSRRTADRRLASARRAFGAATTAEALVMAHRMGLGPAAAPDA